MTYFVEGIQGSGKSTLVKLFSERFPDHKVLEEGDYSPVELAWCAYMGMEDYRAVLEKHSSLKSEIEAKTHFEDDHVVVCYTKIRTEDRSFYQAMEKYEICVPCSGRNTQQKAVQKERDGIIILFEEEIRCPDPVMEDRKMKMFTALIISATILLSLSSCNNAKKTPASSNLGGIKFQG